MTQYRALLEGLVEELQAHEALIVTDWYVGEGLAEEQIQLLETRYGLRLDERVRQFYTAVNGAYIAWELDTQADFALQYRHADDPVQGIVNIQMLGEMLPAWSETLDPAWSEQMPDDDARADLDAFRLFDDNVEEAFVGFLAEEGRVGDALFFHRLGQPLFSLEADIEHYLQALVQARGFLWWQEAYATRPAGSGYDDVFFYIAQLFPDEQFNAFKPTR